MATLVLTVVGTALGGPIGGLIGSFVGAAADRRLFGAARSSGARAADLAVQSSAYGEPIPRLYGRMRVAGAVIWSPGIIERVAHKGGKSGSGSTSYSYSCSFAVALSARPIIGIGRIWADGKLLRNADGSFVYPATIRLYRGTEAQDADPLILARETSAAAPAFRGIAYVVFDDLPLADFANRIPNLTFEVIADDGDTSVDVIVSDLCRAGGLATPVATGAMPKLSGYAAARLGAVRSQLEPLVALADLSLLETETGWHLRSGPATSIIVLPVDDLGAAESGRASAVRQRESKSSLESLPDAIAIGFFDPARDYQLGLQRASRRSPVVRIDQQDFAASMDSLGAKQIAARQLASAVARRSTAELHLPWRHFAIPLGATVRVEGEAAAWSVRSSAIENMVVQLSVERLPFAAPTVSTADAGRSVVANDQPNGPTILHVLDLPPLGGSLPDQPLLWLAAAGSSAGWRRADVEVSLDNGNSYQPLPPITAPTPMGVTETRLDAGPSDRWDLRNDIVVRLLGEAQWLESHDADAVLAGANLALIGDEIVQFADATALGAGRFRLSRLLRGRRATGGAMAAHAGGERFVLLDLDRLTTFAAPIDALGRTLRFRAGRFDSAATEVLLPLQGNALRPLSPSHLATHQLADGSTRFEWIRRSRAGFGWIDATDVALAESTELYRVELWVADRMVRSESVIEPVWTYSVTAREADGASGVTSVIAKVAQVSMAAGVGVWAIAAITLSAL